MKKVFLKFLLSLSVIVMYSMPCFADSVESTPDEQVLQEVASITDEMQNASEDGKITKTEQKMF